MVNARIRQKLDSSANQFCFSRISNGAPSRNSTDFVTIKHRKDVSGLVYRLVYNGEITIKCETVHQPRNAG
jgi:hypothetical protein